MKTYAVEYYLNGHYGTGYTRAETAEKAAKNVTSGLIGSVTQVEAREITGTDEARSLEGTAERF